MSENPIEEEREYGGRGLLQGYEPHENEISSYKYALLSLLSDADFTSVGWTVAAPKMEYHSLAFAFDHPDEDGGLMVPIRLRDLEVYRATRDSRGDWRMEEDVGIFDELPEWATHHPEEDTDEDGD